MNLTSANRTIGDAFGAGRDNNFDFIRFTMAVLVIWSHSFPLLRDSGVTEPLYRLSGGQASFGDIAVNVFFVISGFLIAMSWERSKSPWAYLKSRIYRIYPGFVAVTVLCAFVVAPIFTPTGEPKLTARLLGRPFLDAAILQEYLVKDVFANNPHPGRMYGSVWTIRYEFVCYLVVMALGLLKAMRKRMIVALLFVFFAAAYAEGFPTHWFRFLAFYLAGTTCYLFRDCIPYRDRVAAVSAAVIAGSFFYAPLLPLTLTVCGTYLVFWLAFTKYLSLPHFARYGDFSYGIYLYAYPLQQIIVAKFGSRLSPPLLFLWALPCAVLAGVLSWHLLEKRFLKKKARHIEPVDLGRRERG